MLLREALNLYVSTNPRIQSEGTVRRYEATIISLSKFLEREAAVSDLDSDTYGQWVRYRRDSCGVAPSTLHGEAQKILVIWRWLARRKDFDVEPPEVQLPRKFEQDKGTWTKEEMVRIERAGRNCTWYVGNIPGNVYWPALIGISVETGERFGAIYQLQEQHFDWTTLAVNFPASIRKGQTRDLTRRISLQTARDVQRLLALKPLRPFAVLQRNSMYHPARRLMCDAGLPSSRDRLYHCFRRYYATRIAEDGGNVQRALDHADPRITARYVDSSQLGPEPMPKRPRLWWLRWRWGW